MKLLKKGISAIRSHGIFLSLSMVLLMSSCASKSKFLISEVIPAARGDVKVKKDHNNNYTIQLSLEYLAESGRLTPPKNTYVIWIESDHSGTKNIGQINTTTNTNKLKASFETSSSFAPTRIFISAEDDGTVSYPGSLIVLTTGRLKG